jgi:type IV secretion system protein VirB10
MDRGARLYGRYRSVDLRNARLAVEWTRLLTASGWSVQLAASSMDPRGNAGLPGQRIDHWPRRIGSALIVSLLGDAFQWAAAKEGPRTSTQAGWGGVVEQPYQSQTAEALKELAGQATQASGEVRPTLRIRAGEPLLVALDRDLDFRDLLAR